MRAGTAYAIPATIGQTGTRRWARGGAEVEILYRASAGTMSRSRCCDGVTGNMKYSNLFLLDEDELTPGSPSATDCTQEMRIVASPQQSMELELPSLEVIFQPVA